MLEIGTLVDGKYKILNVIGRGGMSVVYMAINEKANKTWAIKEVRKDGRLDFEEVKQGLTVETNMLKKLRHDNLPSIVDVIEDEDTFIIVMDYIEGKPLSDAIQEFGAQSQESVIKWAKQLCNVLGYLHSQTPAIIYRDMKPSNVMLKPDGNLVLIDFGIAREYKEQNLADTTCLGTIGYAAPEQFGGRGQTDARTDIYCLGATLHHLITGQDPCKPPYTRYPIRHYDGTLSTGLEEILLKCTQDNPEERYQSCAELMYALEHYYELDREYRKNQNRKLGIFAAAAALSLTLFALGTGFHVLADQTQADNYNVYLQDARGSVTFTDKIEKCRAAVELNPSQADAYIYLLEDVLLEDGILSAREDEILREILMGNDGRRTNEAVFKTNQAAYDEFAYALGLAYYYYYEEKGSKSQATKWLDIAANSVVLEEVKVERARRLGKIAAYYSRIGRENKAGDAQIGYLDYWTDLTELSSGDLVQLDNTTTALTMYKELAYQIISYVEKFKAAGVDRASMTAQLDNISHRIAGNEFAGGTQRVNDLKAELLEMIDRARYMVDITYEEEKGDE
ncbi:MAG: serine/threonine protein kinase [Lachnospiraceae bacterium]|nr:serine/threonine protein kinase [Lachnospiraceae bacterium]